MKLMDIEHSMVAWHVRARNFNQRRRDAMKGAGISFTYYDAARAGLGDIEDFDGVAFENGSLIFLDIVDQERMSIPYAILDGSVSEDLWIENWLKVVGDVFTAKKKAEDASREAYDRSVYEKLKERFGS